MSEIVVTNQAPAAPSLVPAAKVEPVAPATAAPAVPANGTTPATPEAPPSAPAQMSEGAREMRELARATRRERQATEDAKKSRARADEVEKLRATDLERIAKAEAFEKLSPAEALKVLEARGMTANELTKVAFSAGTPEEILAKAKEIARKEIEEELGARDKKQTEEAEAKKKEEAKKHIEEERVAAEAQFVETIKAEADKYPTAHKFFQAPTLKHYAMMHAWNVYKQAADNTAKHRPDLAAKGESMYSDQECMKALEDFLKVEYDKLIQGNSPSPDASAARSPSDDAKVSASTAPSVTSAQASGISKLPADFKKKSPEEQKAYWGSVAQQHADARQRR